MVYKFFNKKTKGSGVTAENKSIPQNEQLAEEIHRRENLKEGKYIQHSKTMFGLKIWQICN